MKKNIFWFIITFGKKYRKDKNGRKIYNPRLNFIRINYEQEFLFAMKIAKIIDNKFCIETPVDEIGYLAMFFLQQIQIKWIKKPILK